METKTTQSMQSKNIIEPLTDEDVEDVKEFLKTYPKYEQEKETFDKFVFWWKHSAMNLWLIALREEIEDGGNEYISGEKWPECAFEIDFSEVVWSAVEHDSVLGSKFDILHDSTKLLELTRLLMVCWTTLGQSWEIESFHSVLCESEFGVCIGDPVPIKEDDNWAIYLNGPDEQQKAYIPVEDPDFRVFDENLWKTFPSTKKNSDSIGTPIRDEWKTIMIEILNVITAPPPNNVVNVPWDEPVQTWPDPVKRMTTEAAKLFGNTPKFENFREWQNSLGFRIPKLYSKKSESSDPDDPARGLNVNDFKTVDECLKEAEEALNSKDEEKEEKILAKSVKRKVTDDEEPKSKKTRFEDYFALLRTKLLGKKIALGSDEFIETLGSTGEGFIGYAKWNQLAPKTVEFEWGCFPFVEEDQDPDEKNELQLGKTIVQVAKANGYNVSWSGKTADLIYFEKVPKLE